MTCLAPQIEALEGENKFIVALDHNRKWYRYHHLFRELLRAELERAEPGTASELCLRAADWYVANQEPEAAVAYAQQAGDEEYVARLVGAYGVFEYNRARAATVDGWLIWLEQRGALEREPLAAVLGAWVSALLGKSAEAERWAAAAERGIADSGSEDGENVEPWLRVLRAAECRHGIDRMRADAYAAEHVPGTTSIPFTRAFLGYAGWVLAYDRDIYLLCDGCDESTPALAAADLAMIGLDRVAGWFDATAVDAWRAAGGVPVALTQLTPSEVARRHEAGALVVDVRSTGEWKAGHVAGSVHAPLGRLASLMSDRPRTQSMVLLCEAGSRSAIGASVLEASGFTDVANMSGGITAWRRDGLPLEVDTVVFASST